MLTNATQFVIDTARTASTVVSSLLDSAMHCFQARLMAYNHFLEQKFDRSRNQTSPLTQIYLASLSDNKVYTLKQIMPQPDPEKFVEAMETEVKSMFHEDN